MNDDALPRLRMERGYFKIASRIFPSTVPSRYVGRMTSKGKAGSPRTEAQPFPWDDLSEDQKGATSSILEILATIAERATRGDAERARAPTTKTMFDFMPRVDPERESHVLLIDGGRGTGKSAVLLTLLNAWTRRARKEQLDPEIEARVKDTDMVIPVGLVDLEALPEETNLRFHLVGQLQRVVQAMELRDGAREERRDDRGAWELPFSESPVKVAWRAFLTAATLGGADGLLHRRAHIDPEAFVVEMEETEIHRMDLQPTFRALVDALATYFKNQRLLPQDKSPLFLIAIDDADMKSKLSMPLLQLVRELWHPRVVFLMTGDSRLFGESLRVDVRLAREKAPPEPARPQELADILGLETEMIDQRYRKVVPPGQRYLLPRLRADDQRRILRDALERVPAPQHPLRLHHFLEYLDFVEQAFEILPSNFREIRDLTQWLEAIGRSENDSGGASVKTQNGASHRKFAQIGAQELIWAMTLHSKNYAAEIVQLHKPVSVALTDQVAKLASPPKRWVPKDGYKPIALVGVDMKQNIQFGTFQTGELDLIRTNTKGSWYADSTPFLVAHDACRYEHEDRDAAVYEGLPSLPAIVQTQRGEHFYTWPFPDWGSPIDAIVFWRFFQFVLEPANRSALSIENLVKSYLLAVLEYVGLRDRRHLGSNSRALVGELKDLARQVQDAKPSWLDLANRVQMHAESQTTSRSPVNEWALAGAGLLAAPEIGLGVTVANDWLKAVKENFLPDLWSEARGALNNARANLRKEAQPEIPEDLVELAPDIYMDVEQASDDQGTPGYLWYTLMVDDQLLDREQTWKRFGKAMSQLPVREVEPHKGPLPASLVRYLQAARRSYLVREASPALMNDWVNLVAALGNSQGATVQAVRELWAAVARDETTGMPKVPTNLTATELIRLYEGFGGAADVWRFAPDGRQVNLLPATMMRRGSFRWADGVSLRDPLARIVFEIAWDLVVDTEDNSLRDSDMSSNGRLKWWMAGGCAVDGTLCPWPAVDWWSFLDHILLCGAWNHRLDRVEHLNDRLSAPTRIGDDVAFWYVRDVHQLAETRAARETAGSRWQQGTGKADWVEQIRRMRTHAPQHRDSARWRCYEEWLARVPLLAAPESGLSAEAASWILEAFSLNAAEKANLQEQRVLRMTEGMGQDELQAEETLGRIDRDAKDHPWTKLFDQVT